MARWLLGAPLANLRVLRTAKTKQQAQEILRQHCRRALEACRIGVDVSGVPPESGMGCVVCYNETSFADVLAFNAVMWSHIDRAAAADIYAWIPFARSACRRIGVGLVPRGNRAGTERLVAEMVEAVRLGERVAWGGEGRLSGQDKVLRFKSGASLIAIRSGAPLIPVTFYGGHQTLPLGSIRARPGNIRVRFGEPIATNGLSEDVARDLADHTRAIVAATYKKLSAA